MLFPSVSPEAGATKEGIFSVLGKARRVETNAVTMTTYLDIDEGRPHTVAFDGAQLIVYDDEREAMIYGVSMISHFTNVRGKEEATMLSIMAHPHV